MCQYTLHISHLHITSLKSLPAMAAPSEGKRRRTLKKDGSGDGELLLAASSRVTKAQDIVGGDLLPCLAEENLNSFRSVFPTSSVVLGLKPGDLDSPLSLTWGSCCSGSEGVHFAVLAVQNTLAQQGFKVEFAHAFSCESNKQKRLWIRRVLQSGNVFNRANADHSAHYGCIFKDIGDMSHGQAFCEVHNKECPVKSVDLLFIGTSCKDLSRANGHVDRTRPVLAEAVSRGGSAQTFRGFVNYCEAHRPALILYENVDAIDDKVSAGAENNLSLLMRAMSDLQYQGQKVMTDAQQFGLPCRRRRLYVLFVNTTSSKLSFNARNDGAIGQAFGKMRTLLTACMRTPPCATTCYLQESDAEHKAILDKRLQEIQEIADKRQEAKKAPPTTWVEKHMAYADQLGVRWAAPVPKALEDNPWFGSLTRRESDALRLSRVDGPNCEFRNLSQSVGRINAHSLQTNMMHVGPTMLPGQILWLESQQRMMVGEEALMFQGFPILPLRRRVELPDSCSQNGFLLDLAGNAMALPVVLAVLQAGLAAFEWALPNDDSNSDPAHDDEDVAAALAAVARLA